MSELTQKRLKKLLEYDERSGIFVWKVRRGIVSKGDLAGFLSEDNCVCINIDNRRYLAHRLAWLYVYGEFSANQILHINHKKDDNRIVNLQEGINKAVQSKTSRFTSIDWDKEYQRWDVYLTIEGKRNALGSFVNKKGAFKAMEVIDGLLKLVRSS